MSHARADRLAYVAAELVNIRANLIALVGSERVASAC
jgi:hypothetical protein